MKSHSRDKILPRFAGLNRRLKAGFTLIELAVVLALLIILGAMAGPSLTYIVSGSALSQGGQMIQDQLTLYRQLAVNNNYVVEVRFYNFADSSLGETTNNGHFRGIQAFKVTPQVPQAINTSGAIPQIVFNKTAITRPLRLPPSVIIDAGGNNGTAAHNISYLIYYLNKLSGFYAYNLGPTPNVAPQTPVTGDPNIFNVGTTYTYGAFQFNADGSTNLSIVSTQVANWYMTLHSLNSGDNLSVANLPKNYYTIQIDPNNGHVYGYRP